MSPATFLGPRGLRDRRHADRGRGRAAQARGGAGRAGGPPHLCGREINAETYAICKVGLLLKGETADNIVGGLSRHAIRSVRIPVPPVVELDVREAAADLSNAEPVRTPNRRGIDHTESHSDATEHDKAKEAIP